MTRALRERMIRMIGYIEGLQFAITDAGVGDALESVCETLEEMLKEIEELRNAGREAEGGRRA